MSSEYEVYSQLFPKYFWHKSCHRYRPKSLLSKELRRKIAGGIDVSPYYERSYELKGVFIQSEEGRILICTKSEGG